MTLRRVSIAKAEQSHLWFVGKGSTARFSSYIPLWNTCKSIGWGLATWFEGTDPKCYSLLGFAKATYENRHTSLRCPLGLISGTAYFWIF